MTNHFIEVRITASSDSKTIFNIDKKIGRNTGRCHWRRIKLKIAANCICL